MAPPTPLWNNHAPPPTIPDDGMDDAPPPKPLWGNKKPPVSEEPAADADNDDMPPPVPLWNNKKATPQSALADEDPDDMPPPVPLWNKAASPAKAADAADAVIDDTNAPPPMPLWTNKKKVMIDAPTEAATAAEDDDDEPPAPLGLWNKTSSGATSDASSVGRPSGGKKPRGRSVRGSIMAGAREQVARVMGRRKATSIHKPAATPGGAGVTILRVEDREYELGAVLGHGAYATVRVCKRPETGAIYAVKVFKKSFLKKRRFSAGEWTTHLDSVHREIAIMKRLDHPHVSERGGPRAPPRWPPGALS